MPRIKGTLGKLKNLEEVDQAIREVGVLYARLEEIDHEAEEKIRAIKEEARARGEELRAQIKDLIARIEAFAQYNRDELFKDRKSIQLTHGVFGFRKSTRISVRKTTLELLKKLGMYTYIRVKEEPNREKLAELDDETLAKVDAKRVVEDKFFVEPDREKINLELVG